MGRKEPTYVPGILHWVNIISPVSQYKHSLQSWANSHKSPWTNYSRICDWTGLYIKCDVNSQGLKASEKRGYGGGLDMWEWVLEKGERGLGCEVWTGEEMGTALAKGKMEALHCGVCPCILALSPLRMLIVSLSIVFWRVLGEHDSKYLAGLEWEWTVISAKWTKYSIKTHHAHY